MSTERRSEERLAVRSLEGYGVEEPSGLRVVNVSRKGLAVKCAAPIGPADGVIRFGLPLPGRHRLLPVRARVVWESGSSGENDPLPLQYGLAFSGMEETDALILEAYLEFLRRDAEIARLGPVREKLDRIQRDIEIAHAQEEKKTAAYLH